MGTSSLVIGSLSPSCRQGCSQGISGSAVAPGEKSQGAMRLLEGEPRVRPTPSTTAPPYAATAPSTFPPASPTTACLPAAPALPPIRLSLSRTRRPACPNAAIKGGSNSSGVRMGEGAHGGGACRGAHEEVAHVGGTPVPQVMSTVSTPLVAAGSLVPDT